MDLDYHFEFVQNEPLGFSKSAYRDYSGYPHASASLRYRPLSAGFGFQPSFLKFSDAYSLGLKTDERDNRFVAASESHIGLV